MQNLEPMCMGSPTSPTSPIRGRPQQAPFLPAYLMGDSFSASPTPNSRAWSAAASPPRSSSLNRSVLSSSNAGNLFNNSNLDSTTRDRRAGKTKPGAPPVQGLFESFNAGAGSSSFRGDDLEASQILNQSVDQSGYYHNQTGQGFGHSMTTGPLFNVSQIMSPSPAQLDPFYTQGEMLTTDDVLDESWVTVFGFQPTAASYILQEFAQYGTILKHVFPAEGNWLHLHYQSRIQAKRALSKNGKILGGKMMIGIVQCIDKGVMDRNKENPDNSFRICDQSIAGNTSVFDSSMRTNTPRPLSNAFLAKRNELEGTALQNTPQKNSNIISKAMEYVLGW